MGADKASKVISELMEAGSCLKSEDIAFEVEHLLALPRHVQPGEVLIRPTHQKQ